jgi:signal transduction histidine kinase
MQGTWPPRMLRAPTRDAVAHRYQLEQDLHDDVAIGMSSLAIRLDLLAESATDPSVNAELVAVRLALCDVIEDLRQIGATIYPPVLDGAGLGPAVRSVAERRDLRLRLELPRHDLGAEARTRTGLLIVDHLNTLCPGTSVTVRVRGRRFVRVHITEQRPGQQGRHRHRAALRCE